jgi:TolB protein
MKKMLTLIGFIFCIVTISCNTDSSLTDSDLVEKIIVSEEDVNGTLQLFIHDIDGSNPTQITFNSNKSWMPAISPDGKKVAYVEESNSSADIYLITIGGTENQLLAAGGINITPVWTPDGNHILYTHSPTLDGTIPQRIYIMEAKGFNKTALINETGSYSEVVPTISPDGSQVAFASDRSGHDQFEIWKANIDGTNLTQLTTIAYDSNIQANIQQKVPSWSPDGSKIALWSGVEMNELNQDGGPRDQLIVQSWKICVMNTDGTELTAIDFGDDPTWSTDGNYIYHPDPMNRDQNSNNSISIKKHRPNGNDNITLFKTTKDFGRMDVGFIE